MGRRDKVGGKSAKTPRAKTLKHRDAPKIQRRGISLATGEETNVEQLTRELAEAREREAATAEVLKVISSTPGELEPVFKAMLENAVRICVRNLEISFCARETHFERLLFMAHRGHMSKNDSATQWSVLAPQPGLDAQ